MRPDELADLQHSDDVAVGKVDDRQRQNVPDRRGAALVCRVREVGMGRRVGCLDRLCRCGDEANDPLRDRRSPESLCAFVCVRARACELAYVCTWVHVSVRVRACVRASELACVCTWVHVSVRVCACVHESLKAIATGHR